MEIQCPNCKNVTTCGVNIGVVYFGCPNCFNLFSYKSASEGIDIDEFESRSTDIVLFIGDKGVIKGTEYIITATIVKKVEGYKIWYREYILTAANGDKAFLSETDGHWIFLKETGFEFEIKSSTRYINHNDIELRLYSRDDVKITYAEGFFDYTIPLQKQQMIEFINAPYIYSIEKDADGEAAFFGEHIAPREVKKAFGRSLPSRTGTGMVQPFLFDVRYTAITMCAVAILIVITHLFTYSNRTEAVLLNEDLAFEQYTSREYVSRAFTLTGGKGPLGISLQSNVDNSWASATVALINDKTGEEIYASKDVEYYHGYEGGENWSEGSQREDFNICGVPPGTYHLTVSPQKDPLNVSANVLHLEVRWNSPGYRNVIITCLIMLGFTILIFILDRQFEVKRWAESDFSPYPEQA